METENMNWFAFALHVCFRCVPVQSSGYRPVLNIFLIVSQSYMAAHLCTFTCAISRWLICVPLSEVTPSPMKGKGKGRPSTKAMEKSSPKEEEEEEDPESPLEEEEEEPEKKESSPAPKKTKEAAGGEEDEEDEEEEDGSEEEAPSGED